MPHLQKSALHALAVFATLAFALLSSAVSAQSKEPPSDLCSLFPATQLEEVLEQP